jgi:hypothetical protein
VLARDGGSVIAREVDPSRASFVLRCKEPASVLSGAPQQIIWLPNAGFPILNLISRVAGHAVGRRRRMIMWLLLLLPFIGLLWVPFYNMMEPALFGFPFFYWYQLAWVPITSILIWLVYRNQPHDEAR